VKTGAQRRDELIDELLRILHPQLAEQLPVSEAQKLAMQAAIAHFAGDGAEGS
jgi:hypothetical protein